MFQEKHITKGQARGITLYVGKTSTPARLTDYRPITLLNSDYKIYSMLLANSLCSTFSGLLHPSQNSAASSTTILHAISGLRYINAHDELIATGLCLLALDFTSTRDRISDRYIQRIISYYGFGSSRKSSCCWTQRENPVIR
jgi:hypothetical protein